MESIRKIGPVSSISVAEVQEVLALLIQEKLSKEQASDWAHQRWLLADKGALSYMPPEAEPRLWDAILFLLGVDMQVSPDDYLHSTPDIAEYFRKFEWQVAK
jgi:hypothetical protein